MTDIFIKSFNRPYYLDRCLHSVFTNVSGNFQVTVLDDGTPEKYLQKIKEKYPRVLMVMSKSSSQKAKAIEENLSSGKEIDGFSIPTDLWSDAAKNASDYFIMSEDDVWFSEKINLDELVADCAKYDIYLLKLGWLGNFKDDRDLDIDRLNDKINFAVPLKLFLKNESIMNAFFYNRFKFFTLLYKLGMVDNHTRHRYWALNSILMGLYKKEYWLRIWEGMDGKVDEKRQLINASVYYKNHRKNRNFIARLKKEAMKTTFQSSATNSYHKYGQDFDVNLFNHQINEAWYKGEFDSLQNFPKDFTPDYCIEFLDQRIDRAALISWIESFKKQYREMGCNVEN